MTLHRRIFASAFMCLSAVIVAICTFGVAAGNSAIERISLGAYEVTFAYVDPVDEIRLQAALIDQFSIDQGPSTLNNMIRDITIRSTLDDTRRLHFELG